MTSFFVPMADLKKVLSPEHKQMNDVTCVQVYAVADPSIKHIIPKPLELDDSGFLMFYVSDVKNPTFGEPYKEGGIGVLTKLADPANPLAEPIRGIYYIALLLCGPGAENATFSGREASGLPKKFANAICLEREGSKARFYIERKGTRLLDATLEIGHYNDPAFKNGELDTLDPEKGYVETGLIFSHRFTTDPAVGYKDMEINLYDSRTLYHHYEPACVQIELASSESDPWGEVKIAHILGGSYSRNDNWVESITPLYRYDDSEAWEVMQYLFTGRMDPLPWKE